MTANPLAGLADVFAGLAKVWHAKPLVSAPREGRPMNRAERRRAGRTRPTATTTGQARARARRAGEAAGRAGAKHTDPGVCPYTNRALIDAWSAGYVDGQNARRKREART